MVLMIALSACMFFSNISWFYMEILCGKVSFGFSTLWIMAMPASSANWWHCIFWWRSSTPSFPVVFSSFRNGAVTSGLFCARGSVDYYASHNICKNLPFVKDYIQAMYTFPTMNTSFLVCLSFPSTTVLEKKPVYEGGGAKWFLRYLIFSWD